MLNKYFFVYFYFKACNINDIKTICFFGKTNWYQIIAVIISTICVNDSKCPFNTDNLDHKHLFSLLSSARSHDVNSRHDKSLDIIPVNTLSATFIHE